MWPLLGLENLGSGKLSIKFSKVELSISYLSSSVTSFSINSGTEVKTLYLLKIL